MGRTGIGTVPHGLIAAYGGDTVKAAQKFAERFHDEMNITVLVDWENDSVRTALEVAEALGPEAVGSPAGHLRAAGRPLAVGRDGRLQADRRQPPAGREGPRPRSTRRASPTCGSWPAAGSTPQRIREFEAAGVPVDAYGVGSSLIRGQNDFTADVVIVDGRPCAKVGRGYSANPRLERVE